jgi:NAD(P)H-hydrate epimerase
VDYNEAMKYSKPTMPVRLPSGHKGTFGTLIVIGGYEGKSDVMFGGTALSGIGALRTGIGKCIFAMPEDVLKEAIKIVPQSTGFPLSESSLVELEKLVKEKADCILIGPAFGLGEFQQKVLATVLDSGKPAVIDADALNIISANPHVFKATQTIITPQPMEFERLANAFGFTEIGDKAADELAEKLNTIVVLKNSRTYITNGKPALAAAGSGDLLSGIIAGLVTQFYPKNLSLFENAKLGVSIHSKAGELWSKKHGDQGALITELADLIPEAIEII